MRDASKLPQAEGLSVRTADVYDSSQVAAAVAGSDVVLSAFSSAHEDDDVQAKHLHSASDLIHEEKDSWMRRLPPMLAMERLLVRVLVLGFVLLSGLILTGMFFGESVWGAPLKWNHKTLFTLLAWVVIAVLLLGRKAWGWRGLMLVRSTIIGFVLLFLAYAGTHFVMDVVLHRTY